MKPCIANDISGKLNGPGGATNATPGPEQREPVREVHTMPDNSQYRRIAPHFNPEHHRAREERRTAIQVAVQ